MLYNTTFNLMYQIDHLNQYLKRGNWLNSKRIRIDRTKMSLFIILYFHTTLLVQLKLLSRHAPQCCGVNCISPENRIPNTWSQSYWNNYLTFLYKFYSWTVHVIVKWYYKVKRPVRFPLFEISWGNRNVVRPGRQEI